MEAPASRSYGFVHDEKAEVFQAMRPLDPGDMMRGQNVGYRDEPDVAKNSDVETFCASGFSSTRGAGRGCRGTCAPANILRRP